MSLSPDRFRVQIAEAKKGLQQLLIEQRRTNQEIEDLRNLIRANANFLPDNEREQEIYALEFLKHPTNITEAVRLALFVAMAREQKVTPVEIREIAESFGFDFSEYSNPMASIHTVLKRMRDADPSEVNYDEQTSRYWFVVDPEDVINPDILPTVYLKAIGVLTQNVGKEKAMDAAKRAGEQMIHTYRSKIKRVKD